MHSPEISVIVPVYNVEKYLRRCIDSILAQTYTDFEILLVDDGSTDGSLAICNDYASRDCRVRVFHQANGGASSARNLGMEKVSGKWLTFCDADDYVYPNWLENYDFQHAGKHQLIQQGACSDKPTFIYKGNHDTRCGFDYIGNPEEYLIRLTESMIIGYVWMKAFRTDIIKKNNLRLDIGVKLKEDEIFLIRYLGYVQYVKSVDKHGYFYYAPDWNRKYVRRLREKVAYCNAYYNALNEYSSAHSFDSRFGFIANSFVDEQMKVFACIPSMKNYSRIKNIILKSYDSCKLLTPLKWIICHDKTRLMSYPALLAHSVLRNFFNK